MTFIQTSLFDVDIAASRKQDPDSSHIAEQEAKSSIKRQREEVYEMVRKHPWATAKELAWHFDVDRYMVSRRLPELEKLELVKRLREPPSAEDPKGKPVLRVCKAGGKPSCVWSVVENIP